MNKAVAWGCLGMGQQPDHVGSFLSGILGYFLKKARSIVPAVGHTMPDVFLDFMRCGSDPAGGLLRPRSGYF